MITNSTSTIKHRLLWAAIAALTLLALSPQILYACSIAIPPYELTLNCEANVCAQAFLVNPFSESVTDVSLDPEPQQIADQALAFFEGQALDGTYTLYVDQACYEAPLTQCLDYDFESLEKSRDDYDVVYAEAVEQQVNMRHQRVLRERLEASQLRATYVVGALLLIVLPIGLMIRVAPPWVWRLAIAFVAISVALFLSRYPFVYDSCGPLDTDINMAIRQLAMWSVGVVLVGAVGRWYFGRNQHPA